MAHISIDLTGDRSGKSVTIDQFPDRCPQCHYAGKQTRMLALPVQSHGGSSKTLWIGLICPVKKCGKPFFAVYEEPFSPIGMYNPDYQYSHSTPMTPDTYQRDEVLAELSPEFYDIMDQSLAAEQRRLDLIAGMGYRKALEYLVKDYVTREIHQRLNALSASGDAEAKEKAAEEWSAIVMQPLANIIKMIPHALLQQAAERAAWLGNDETHYTRLWNKHDVDDLKQLVFIVMNYMSMELKAQKYVDSMPKPTKK
jgi:hypothetical protein